MWKKSRYIIVVTFPTRQRSSRESYGQESETDEDEIDPDNVGPDEVKRTADGELI